MITYIETFVAFFFAKKNVSGTIWKRAKTDVKQFGGDAYDEMVVLKVATVSPMTLNGCLPK